MLGITLGNIALTWCLRQTMPGVKEHMEGKKVVWAPDWINVPTKCILTFGMGSAEHLRSWAPSHGNVEQCSQEATPRKQAAHVVKNISEWVCKKIGFVMNEARFIVLARLVEIAAGVVLLAVMNAAVALCVGGGMVNNFFRGWMSGAFIETVCCGARRFPVLENKIEGWEQSLRTQAEAGGWMGEPPVLPQAPEKKT